MSQQQDIDPKEQEYVGFIAELNNFSEQITQIPDKGLNDITYLKTELAKFITYFKNSENSAYFNKWKQSVGEALTYFTSQLFLKYNNYDGENKEEVGKAIEEINTSIAQAISGQTTPPPESEKPDTTQTDSKPYDFILPWEKEFWDYYGLVNPITYWGLDKLLAGKTDDKKESTSGQSENKPSDTTKPSEAPKPEESTGSENSGTPSTPESPSAPESSSGAETPEAGNQETPSSEEADMIKLHGSFNPESPVDQRKLQMYRQAKQQVGPSGSFEDLARAAYKIQYGDTGRYNIEPTKSRRQKGTKSPTAPVTPGKPIYFVRISAGNYRPAVNADLTSGQQLFVRNPNKIARTVYPFIKIQNAPVRRADLP